MTVSAEYIDTPVQLEALCERLAGTPFIALDTEFIRERTYSARLCLLQVANQALLACVDPLALPSLDPLLDLIYDPGITKVLHSARQDLEILFELRGVPPRPIFDTQVAATVLGHGDQIGYAALVKAELGVRLSKAHTRTDWCARPLDPGQLRYAADDVRYLVQIYQHQRGELETSGRLAWLTEDFDALSDARQYDYTPQEMWRRVKGLQALRGQQLAVLRSLAAWREQEARTHDKPRRWILSDEVLLELARHMPTAPEQLARVRGLEVKAARRLGPQLVGLIAAAREQPREEWPHQPPRRELFAHQEALIDALMAVVRIKGAEHKVSTTALCTRRDLERLVSGERDVALLHGWRKALAGNEVLRLLEGKARLEVDAGRLRVDRVEES